VSFNWRHELLTIATLAMEALWIYSWLRLFFAMLDPAGRHLTLVSCFLLLFLATYAGRLLAPAADQDEDDAGVRRRQATMVGLIAVAVLLVVHAGLFGKYAIWHPGWVHDLLAALGRADLVSILAVVGSLGLWYRGMEHAQGSFTVEATGFRFRLGVAAFVWLLLIEGVLPVEPMTPLLFGFFGVALLAMALARVEEVGLSQAGIPSPFNRIWFGIVLGATLVAMLIAGSATQIFSLPMIYRLVGLFEPVAGRLDQVFYWIFSGIILLVALIARLLEPLFMFLFNGLSEAMGREPITLPSLSPGPLLRPEGQPPVPPEILRLLIPLRWGLVAGLILFVVFVVVSTLERQRRLREASVPELRESVWSAQAFADDLADLLARARRRLRGLADVRDRLRQAYATATIRQIYASLCHWAAGQGHPRPAPETPYEYLPELIGALPGREAELRLITEAYVRVRYGEAPTPREELGRVRAAWQRVRLSGKQKT
jgi:hypothetical protein